MPKLLSEVPFGAFLAYSPNGPDSEPHRSSKALRSAIKSDGTYLGEPAIDLAVRRLGERRPEVIMGLFAPGVVLVPAPRSSPFPSGLQIPLRGGVEDFQWIPKRLCTALVENGVASAWMPLLTRETRVPRSSRSRPADRPRPQTHLDSMALSTQSVTATDFVVVDDVVTRGATLLACCSLLVSAYPAATVRSFALLRAISDPADFRGILDPVVGNIFLREGGDTLRRP